MMSLVQKFLPPVFLIFFLLSLSGSFVFAQRDLEVPLPGIGGETEITKTPLLPEYVKYIFNVSIAIGGLIAFGALFYGGVRYLTSAGNPAAMSDANSQIFSALLGLALLLGSWVLLTTINPQLVVINPEYKPAGSVSITVPGVYLCKNAGSIATSSDCQLFTESKAGVGTLNDQIGNVRFVNETGTQYGVVLHRDTNFIGRCAICLGGDCSAEIAKVDGVSSLTLFVQAGSSSGGGVSLYEKIDYNNDCEPGKCWQWGPQTSAHIGDLHQTGRSIKIEGNYLAALYSGANFTDRCEVFTQSVPNLAGHYINYCNPGYGFFSFTKVACFNSIDVLPILYKK